MAWPWRISDCEHGWYIGADQRYIFGPLPENLHPASRIRPGPRVVAFDHNHTRSKPSAPRPVARVKADPPRLSEEAAQQAREHFEPLLDPYRWSRK